MFVVDDQHAPDDFGLIGFYSQAYSEIVKSNQVWRVSKYFLRRWGPYLGPTRFWAVVAARQLCYWNDHRDWFSGYDAHVAAETQVSRVHYRRLKGEMDEASSPLSLFINREETGYHVVNGKTRPQPTTYHVRLDDPLTPADASYLALWFHNQPARRKAAEVVTLLQEAAQRSRHELLAPHFGTHLQQPPATFTAQTVHDVVQQVFGRHVADQPEVRKQAEVLHAHLTDADFVGKQYFRQTWLSRLKPGPAFVLTYLRSLCYFNEETGELRNQVTINRQELAETLGVKPNTLSDWFKALAEAAPPQAVPPFMSLLDSGRTADNSFEFVYEIGMLDPLPEDDLARYDEMVQAVGENAFVHAKPGGSVFDHHTNGQKNGSRSENDSHREAAAPPSQSENDRHEETRIRPSQSVFDRHKTAPPSPSSSENERHETGSDSVEPRLITRQAENERHTHHQDAILIEGQAGIEQGSIRRGSSFKYYKSLLALTEEEENSIQHLLTAESQAPGWHLSWADRSLARAACQNEYERLLDLLEVDHGGPSRERMKRGGLSIDETAAWWLYAQTQEKLERPLNLVIARVSSGAKPPSSFQSLAEMSWEVWRSYAIARHLPPTERPSWPDPPHYERWMSLYGKLPAEALPFGVGLGLPEAVALVYDRCCAAADPPPDDPLWPRIVAAVRTEIDPALAAIFLEPVSCRLQEAGRLVLVVPDGTARAYLEQALRGRLEAAARELTGQGWKIELETADPLPASPPEATPATEDQTGRYVPIWEAARGELALQMTRATFDRWLREAELLFADGRRFEIAVASEQAQAWLTHRLHKNVLRTLRALHGEVETVEFTVR